MIIFYKKRILFLNLVFICSILFYSITSHGTPTTTVSSTPVSNHTIILDAGHGLPDGGATSSDGETLESDLNLQIVLKLQSLLEAADCTVILTRSDENGIYEADKETIREKKISDMNNRIDIGNNSDAEVFVSIHMNKIPQKQYSGWQSFYKNDDTESKELANSIQSNLNYFIEKNNNREIASISNIFLTRKVEIPLVIIECGFLSNEDELQLLKTDEYQDLLSWSIFAGIMDYFN